MTFLVGALLLLLLAAGPSNAYLISDPVSTLNIDVKDGIISSVLYQNTVIMVFNGLQHCYQVLKKWDGIIEFMT
jgi:hypothetical protein